MEIIRKNEPKLDKVAKTIKNILYIGALIVAICTSVTMTVNNVFEQKISEYTVSIQMRIAELEAHVQSQLEKNIYIQSTKITRQDYTDIAMEDILEAIHSFSKIKDPPPQLRVAYDIVYNWYREQIVSNRSSGPRYD